MVFACVLSWVEIFYGLHSSDPLTPFFRFAAAAARRRDPRTPLARPVAPDHPTSRTASHRVTLFARSAAKFFLILRLRRAVSKLSLSRPASF